MEQAARARNLSGACDRPRLDGFPMSSTVTADELDYVEIDRPLVELAINALGSAERSELRVVTAESCTGGLIATVLSEAPGAADYFDGAFVCYTADHKCAALGVDPKLIERD